MLNYDTILSNYDDKLTLMQWLKKVEAALKDASAKAFNVNKKGNATISFEIVFEDGSKLESGDIVLQQGESVTGAAIVGGHLILTLSNGDTLDAGELLNGDLNVTGKVTTTGNIEAGAKVIATTDVEAGGALKGASAAINGGINANGNISASGTITAAGSITSTAGGIQAAAGVSGASGTFPILNGENNPSVKPVYIHPITIFGYSNDNTKRLQIAIFIFNNSPMHIDTIALIESTFASIYAAAGGPANVLTTGGFKWTSGGYNDGYPSVAQAIYIPSGSNFQITGLSTHDGTSNSITSWSEVSALENMYISDGVNKIN